VPLCYTTQVSELLSYNVSPTGDTLVATWTRPLTLGDALIQAGYVDIVAGPMQLISALLGGAATASYVHCFPVLTQHTSVGQKTAPIVPNASPSQLPSPQPATSSSPSQTPSTSAQPSFNPYNPRICIDSSCSMALQTAISGDNLTFTGTCSTPGTAISWCAFGLSQSGGPLPLMVPAEAFVVQVDSSGNVVSERELHCTTCLVSDLDSQAAYEHFLLAHFLQHLEDRRVISYSAPQCYPSQVSQLLSFTLSPSGDTLVATWTRPQTLSDALVQGGYVNIVAGPMQLISALLGGGATSSYIHCFPVLLQHSAVGQKTAPLVPQPLPPPDNGGSHSSPPLSPAVQAGISFGVILLLLSAAGAALVWRLHSVKGSTAAHEHLIHEDDSGLY
jgi:hypothetical protein